MYFQAYLSIHTYLKKSRKNPQKYLKGEGSIKSNFLLCNYGFFQYNELSPSKIDLLFIKWQCIQENPTVKFNLQEPVN